MAKRKRESGTLAETGHEPDNVKKAKGHADGPRISDFPVTIQIIAGSYDRVLHGVTATIESAAVDKTGHGQALFADTFLFTAHTSSIRCLALSPPSAPTPGQSQKVMLATGSADERINVFNLSAHPPSQRSRSRQALLSSLAARPILENPKNRELGTLLHHSAAVTRLAFPTRAKLLSAAEDSSIAVTRTRDWAVLSTVRCPVPKAVGRPSGDTAPVGATPAGVNDFAVHPSLKLMISVGKGERCMRLWNLVTGKKAGVLNFGRDVLRDVGEGKHSTGEGRKVVWGIADGADEFAVAFDRNVVVFGMDSQPKCRVLKDARTKLHAVFYVQTDDNGEDTVLAVSTEDGRVLFFSTKRDSLHQDEDEGKKQSVPVARLVAELGGREAGVSGRIKDFKILRAGKDGKAGGGWYLVSGSSDGKLRVWSLTAEDLSLAEDEKPGKKVGRLRGTYETQNRITCLEAFVMIPRPDGVGDSDEEVSDREEDPNDEDDSDEEDENKKD